VKEQHTSELVLSLLLSVRMKNTKLKNLESCGLGVAALNMVGEA
jgi:hypothetical protein